MFWPGNRARVLVLPGAWGLNGHVARGRAGWPSLSKARAAAVVPWLALVVAALLPRVALLDLAPFKLDEVDALSRAHAFVSTGVLPASGGQMSWGFPDPPVVIYLLALPALVSRDPAVAAAFLGLLDALSVLVTAATGAALFGRRAGLIAGLLYAAAPWAVYYARDVWVNVIPLFSSVALYAAVQVLGHDRRRWALVFFVALALQGGTHLSAAALLPTVAAGLLLFASRWWSRASALGLLGGVLLLLPYLLSIRNLGGQFLGKAATMLDMPGAGDVGTSIARALWAASGHDLAALLDGKPGTFGAAGPLLVVSNLLYAGLMAAGLVGAVLAARARVPAWRGQVFVAIWGVLTTLVLAFSATAPPLHYFTLLYPAPFLLAAGGLVALSFHDVRAAAVLRTAALQRPYRPGRYGLLAHLARGAKCASTSYQLGWHFVSRAAARGMRTLTRAVPAALLLVQTGSLVWVAAELRASNLGGAVGLPLGTWDEVSREARRQANAGATGADLYVLTRGFDPAYHDMPAALSYAMGPDLKPRFVQSAALVLAPGRSSLYLDLLGDRRVSDLLDRFGRMTGSVALPGGVERARFFRMTAPTADEADRLPSHQRPLQTSWGVDLLGYDLTARVSAADGIAVTSYWRVREMLPVVREGDLALFHHVLDGSQKVAQQDGIGVFSRSWRVGDVLVDRQIVRLGPATRPGEYHVLFGLYSRRSGQRATFAPEGDALDLGPIEVVAS